MTFLAGGVAFNILLAGVPFILLLAGALGFLLGETLDSSTGIVQGFLRAMLPQTAVEGSMLDPILADVVRTRTAFGIGGGIGFLWFSARLFASLRSVMTTVFAHGRDRTVLGGMLWDLNLTVMTVILLTAWISVSAFLSVTSGTISAALVARGVRVEVMSGVEVLAGRAIVFALVVAIFFALYRWLPKRRTAWIPALAGGVVAALLFELARWLFGAVFAIFPPTTVYTGTLGALVLVVFWTFYAALVFVLGAEVASAVTTARTSTETA